MNKQISLTIPIICLVIIFAFLLLKDVKEKFTFPENYGRSLDGKFKCGCGNMDWYLGKNYNKYCPNVTPAAFLNTEKIEGFEIKTELNAKDAYVGNLEYHKQNKMCKKLNPTWKAAFNPTICTQGDKLIAEANCMCVDMRYNCAKCFPKVDLSKYLDAGAKAQYANKPKKPIRPVRRVKMCPCSESNS